MSLSALHLVRVPIRVASLAVLSVLLLVAGTTSASAATYSATGLSATVNGTSVTARVVLASNPQIVADWAKICVRSATGANYDFLGSRNYTLPVTGSAWQSTRTFPAGTYRYFGCVYEAGRWTDLGPSKTFTVGASAAAGGVSGAPMPVGNLPGWRQTFTEDFNQPLSRGSFPGPYASKWTSYSGFPNHSKAGTYDKKIISAQNGVLDLHLHAENGRPLTAAPVPLVNGRWGGQTYGRFSVRMKADAIGGYGATFLLWPDSDNWYEGEIDYPESTFSEVVKGYNHCIGNPAVNCLWFNTDKRYNTWHTYTIDWRPEKLTFLLDGVVVGTTTRDIPNKPMHWVMQVESPTPSSALKTSGHVLIDWATIYSRA
jgi:hypothetical protein